MKVKKKQIKCIVCGYEYTSLSFKNEQCPHCRTKFNVYEGYLNKKESK